MYYAAQDIIEYLMASSSGGAQDGEHRLLRAASHNAYRDVINARDWNWHVAEAVLATSRNDALQPIGSGNDTTSFTLPENVKNVDALIPHESIGIPTSYVTPTEWLRIEVRFPQLNAPILWTVIKDPLLPDRWLLKLAGSVTQEAGKEFRYTYRRQPPMLRYMGYEPAVRVPGFAVTGAVRRYGTASLFPESAYGVNTYTAQEIIGLAGSMQGTPPSNAKTAVSDYLDVSQTMYTAVLSGAEMWMARLMGKNVEGASAIFARDLRLAFEADGVAPIAGNRAGGNLISTARALGYYSSAGPDTGV
jgi:hypothetical protein